MSKKAIEVVFFIESTVASIESIIKEVKALDSAGPEWGARMKNLKLRIALRLTTLLKEAIANDAFENLRGSLENKSALVLASLSGVGTEAGWETIKHSVSKLLSAVVSDLNASKPQGVL